MIWKSLKTDKVSVAQLRLADMQKAERVIASRRSEVQRGKMTFGESRTVPMIAEMRSLVEEIRAQGPDDGQTPAWRLNPDFIYRFIDGYRCATIRF